MIHRSCSYSSFWLIRSCLSGVDPFIKTKWATRGRQRKGCREPPGANRLFSPRGLAPHSSPLNRKSAGQLSGATQPREAAGTSAWPYPDQHDRSIWSEIRYSAAMVQLLSSLSSPQPVGRSTSHDSSRPAGLLRPGAMLWSGCRPARRACVSVKCDVVDVPDLTQ